MKIIVNGREEEALNLILQKTFAEQMIAGTKRLEVRNFSDFYVKQLLDTKQFNKFIKSVEDPDAEYDETKSVFKQKYKYLHFRNRQNTWFLDIECKQMFVDFVEPDAIRQLGEEFGFHDYDYLIPQLEAEGDGAEIDNIFCFEVGKVIATNL